MNMPLKPADIAYLIVWAREDDQAQATGPARMLQRRHAVPPAILGQLFARLSTVSGRSQYEMVQGPIPESSITVLGPPRQLSKPDSKNFCQRAPSVTWMSWECWRELRYLHKTTAPLLDTTPSFPSPPAARQCLHSPVRPHEFRCRRMKCALNRISHRS